MSLSRYAKYRKERKMIGGTLQAVQDAIRTGRVSQNEDGLVDPEVADREWKDRTNRSVGGPAHRRAGQVTYEHEPEVREEIEGRGAVPITAAPVNGHRKSYSEDDHPLVLKIQADYRLKLAKAEEAELKNALLKKQLLDANAVREENVRQAKAVRDHMLSFASRRSGDISAELGIRERLTYEVLDRAMRAHLAELSRDLQEDRQEKEGGGRDG